MKAKAVIMIGRKRSFAPSVAAAARPMPLPLVALLGELDDQDGVLGGQAHQRDDADLDIDVVFQAAPS